MCFSSFKWFRRRSVSSSNDPHSYIHDVLERGDHGPYRHIQFDLRTLNDAIQKDAERIARSIEADVKKAAAGDHDKEVTLQNHLGNVTFKCIVSTPHNLSELVQIMAKAKRENQSVKAIGGFYAFSSVCETTGYAIKTDHLVGTSPTPAATLKDPAHAEGLYDVLCGTSFQQVVDALEKDGRALMNLGGFAGQSSIGATATGTHGSGLTIPPLASMILGINLVSGQFDSSSGLPIQYRIEPTNGITDPKSHPPSWILIQDDQEFNAAMTGLGAMGVIYSTTITSVPFYWVRELREIVDWPTARGLLEQGPQGDILMYHNAEVWINPYTSKVLLTRREKITTPPAGELAGPNSHMFAAITKDLSALHAVVDHIFSDPITDLEGLLGIILALLLRLFPLLLPSALDLALQTQNHSQPKVAKYYDLYEIGLADNFPAISTEISYPMTSYLAATDATISLLQKLRKQNIHQGVVSPVSLRFTASTPANLSMSYSINPSESLGRCYIELPSLFYFYESVQIYDAISRPHSEESINTYQGRMHWGQYITPSFTTLQYQPHDPEFYASIASFKEVAEKYDPGHMMANAFLRKVIWLETGRGN